MPLLDLRWFFTFSTRPSWCFFGAFSGSSTLCGPSTLLASWSAATGGVEGGASPVSSALLASFAGGVGGSALAGAVFHRGSFSGGVGGSALSGAVFRRACITAKIFLTCMGFAPDLNSSPCKEEADGQSTLGRVRCQTSGCNRPGALTEAATMHASARDLPAGCRAPHQLQQARLRGRFPCPPANRGGHWRSMPSGVPVPWNGRSCAAVAVAGLFESGLEFATKPLPDSSVQPA